jgi:hypothetical protein
MVAALRMAREHVNWTACLHRMATSTASESMKRDEGKSMQPCGAGVESTPWWMLRCCWGPRKDRLEMNRLTVWFGLTLVIGFAGQSSLAGDKKALEGVEYFPLKVGTTWEYLVNGKHIVVKVGAHEKVGEVFCARLDTFMDGVVVTEHLAVKRGPGDTREGLYRVFANGQRVEPPFLILYVNAKSGDKWGKMTCREDKIKVGGKDYTTLLVASQGLKISNQDVEMKTWFDKNVGIVKQVYLQPDLDLNVTLELEKFTPG